MAVRERPTYRGSSLRRHFTALGLVIAAFSAVLSFPVSAQEAADPDNCRFRPEKYVATAGVQVHSKKYFSRDQSFSFQDSLGANVRARLKFDMAAATSAAWRLRLISADNACTNAGEFAIDSAMIARHGDNLLSPVMCGRLRLEWKIDDLGDAPPVELTVYKLEVPYQQLGIYDSKNRLNGPNWCEASEFEPAGEGAPSVKLYAPAPNAISAAASSAVFIGWEEKKLRPKWAIPAQRNEYQAEYALNSCTGLFIAADLVLTNRHCVCPVGESKGRACPGDRGEPAFDGAETFSTLSEGRRVEAREWRIWSRAARGARGRNDAPLFHRASPVILGALRPDQDDWAETSPYPLDYAVLRLDLREVAGANFDAPLARLSIKDPPADAELLIAHYPGNYPFVLSYDRDCKVVQPEVIPGTPSGSVFVGHGCDTHGGSSGAPVFLRNLAGVVGVHFCCTRPIDNIAFELLEGAPNSVEDLSALHPQVGKQAKEPNKFVPIRRIVCDIRRRNAQLFEEIAGAQRWTAADRQEIESICERL